MIVEVVVLDFGDALQMDGAGRAESLKQIVVMARTGLVTVFLACFGRCIAEVGAILLVGGNIRGATRTMTTAIALALLVFSYILLCLVYGLNRRAFAWGGR